MLTLNQAPTVEPITLAECKAHARVFTNGDDQYIQDLIPVARQKWELDTGYFLSEREYEYTTTGTSITLPLRPVLSVESVNELTESDYVLSVDASTGVGTLTLLEPVDGDVVVTFKVGFANPEEPVDPEEDPEPHPAPALAKHALKSLISHLYESREAYQQGNLMSVPGTYQSIVASYRLA